MKKLFALLLSVLMLFTLTACEEEHVDLALDIAIAVMDELEAYENAQNSGLPGNLGEDAESVEVIPEFSGDAYVTVNGNTAYTGMSALKRTVTGNGYFTGANANEYFNTLAALCDGMPRTLTHPYYGSCNAYLTCVEMTQEPREDHVAYSFEFRGADADNVIPK